jgi:Phosphotransferase enzyme family
VPVSDSQKLSALDQRALAAAGTVASAHGLEPDEPVVIHSGSNVLLHLRPAPVVARVMTGTVALHDDPRAWLEREGSVLEFLAPSGLAVSPSRLIAPGPHCHDGLWMTFTEWIPEVEPAPEPHPPTPPGDARELGRALRELHDELRPFQGELGGLSELHQDIARLLGQIRPADARGSDAVSSLREQLDALGTVVFESDLPTQALHGDVSLRNLLRTPRRLVWNDFEDTFRGPVHWDVASYIGSLRIHGATETFVREMLASYGWDDEDELAPFLAAQDVYDEIWRMYDRQRRGSALSVGSNAGAGRPGPTGPAEHR